MGASGNGSRKELAKLSISRTDTGGTEALLEVVPHLLDHQEIDESLLNLYITLPFFPCVSTCIILIYT